MGFHLYLPQMRLTHEAIVERALAAEAAGFEGMAFMDHLAPPMALDQPMFDALTTAAWVLANTTTLVVGHLVLCDAFHHPAVLARQAMSLDQASQGRFELGIGWGSVPDEFATFGIGARPAADRVARLAESLTIMRGLWSGEPVNHDGTHFTLIGAQQAPVPTRRIPIVIGGTGITTMALVREHADWWNVPVHMLDRADAMREHAGTARVSMQCVVALVPSAADRADVAAMVQRRYGGTPMAQNAVIGTASELADHFQTLSEQGVERFYVWFADFAPVATLESFASVVDAF